MRVAPLPHRRGSGAGRRLLVHVDGFGAGADGGGAQVLVRIVATAEDDGRDEDPPDRPSSVLSRVSPDDAVQAPVQEAQGNQ